MNYILDGDDLTASTGSIINLLSELMHYGKDELIFAVVGSDASQILPSLLPLMLHSLLHTIQDTNMEKYPPVLLLI